MFTSDLCCGLCKFNVNRWDESILMSLDMCMAQGEIIIVIGDVVKTGQSIIMTMVFLISPETTALFHTFIKAFPSY